MAGTSTTDRLYQEVESFIGKAHSSRSLSSESMHMLMCILMTSAAYVRDPTYALETLMQHLGPDSRLGMTEEQCQQMERAIRPLVLEHSNRQPEY
jgi:hypothetical protein